ncbi:VOC family protein [Paludisphaera mucosa]|uniref:VOC family protein n=1 Tax=Paludisphaera mucosa TaxID=3030827 RepID=A0ABT6FLB1_9BACT|nr:VOC family protein [Paludisphaera mucosa]MDG3008362.1 VOC family protein [Paludisphaera mucosa]
MKFTSGEINVVCTDAPKSLYFYTRVLGFELVEEEDGAYRLRNGDVFYLLLPFATGPSPHRSYCACASISFDLMTVDVRGAADHFSAHGVLFEKPFAEGSRSFIIRDPDDNIIEIIEAVDGLR